ncbi:MAG: hypothetical protein R3362_01330 [Rhodothermales bacterium]|nr:hypothetical protein [Rhodothermales bacterium]
MSEQARDAELDALVQHARDANGSVTTDLRSQIKAFELRYEMTSEGLLVALEAGEQKETAEIVEWLYLLDALESQTEADAR